MFKGPCSRKCNFGCAECQIGCFRPARHRNPFFGTDYSTDAYWWRGGYNYAEYLCAECYDEMVSDAKEWEESFREEEGDAFVEDPEYTRILKSL